MAPVVVLGLNQRHSPTPSRRTVSRARAVTLCKHHNRQPYTNHGLVSAGTMEIRPDLPPPDLSPCRNRCRCLHSMCLASLRNCTNSMGCGWCSSLEEQDAVAIHVRKAFAPLSGPFLCMAWRLVPSPPLSQAYGIPQCELRLVAELQYPMPSAARSGGSPAKAASQDGPDFLSLSDGCGQRLPEVEFLEGLGAEALS